LPSPAALHIVIHVVRTYDKSEVFSLRNDTFRGVIATCVLVVTFAYHVFNEILNIKNQPGYALTGGFSVIRAGIFASFGLIAADAFKNEADANDRLERLVQERTSQIMQQSQHLRMVEKALEASETAIAITGKDQRIVWCNPALLRLTGNSNKNLNGTSVVDVLQPSDSDRRKIMRCFHDRMSLEEEITVKDVDMQIQVASFVENVTHSYGVLQAAKNDDALEGTDNKFIVILNDLTEKKKRQVAEEAARKEVLLKQAMSESCQILSHELRTPLQGIMGITSMLLDGRELQNDAEEALTLVMVSSRLLLTLINNMLDVCKCEANLVSEFEVIPTDLYQPIENAVNFCRPLGSMSNVQIDLFPLKVRDVVVASDALRLQQVVINLVSNSIKHSNPGSITTVRSEVTTLADAEGRIRNALKAGSHQEAFDIEFKDRKHEMKVVIVSISDRGKGIDVRQVHRLFQKFGQLNEHSSGSLGGTNTSNCVPGQPSGTGLGLNLCLKFIHRMKGNIWAINNPDGVGACFSFYLPLISGGAVPRQRPSSNGTLANATTVVSPVASSCRVLVVDDTLINLKVLDRMLKQVGVKFATCVDSGYKAMQMLEENDYNLVITDIQMPGMSGTELCENICKLNTLLKKPTIVGLTAEVSKAMDDKCSKSGMIKVLHKPLTAHQLKDFFDQTISPIITPSRQ
jgi:PAS domain S-box-containing protein